MSASPTVNVSNKLTRATEMPYFSNNNMILL